MEIIYHLTQDDVRFAHDYVFEESKKIRPRRQLPQKYPWMFLIAGVIVWALFGKDLGVWSSRIFLICTVDLFFWWGFWRNWGMLAIIHIGLAFGMVASEYSGDLGGWKLELSAGLLVLGLAAIVWPIVKLIFRLIFKNPAPNLLTIEFRTRVAPNGLKNETEWKTTVTPWEEMRGLEVRPDYIIFDLSIKDGLLLMVFVPKRAFAEEKDFADFVSLAQRYLDDSRP